MPKQNSFAQLVYGDQTPPPKPAAKQAVKLVPKATKPAPKAKPIAGRFKKLGDAVLAAAQARAEATAAVAPDDGTAAERATQAQASKLAEQITTAARRGVRL